jgi:hypothetical protein
VYPFNRFVARKDESALPFMKGFRPVTRRGTKGLVRVQTPDYFAVGFGLVLQPVARPDRTTDERLAAVLNGLPDQAIVQFAVLSVPQVQSYLENWRQARLESCDYPAVREAVESRYQMMVDAAAERQSVIPKRRAVPLTRHHYVFVYLPQPDGHAFDAEGDKTALHLRVGDIRNEFCKALAVQAGIANRLLEEPDYQFIWGELLNQQAAMSRRAAKVAHEESVFDEETTAPPPSFPESALLEDTTVTQKPGGQVSFRDASGELDMGALVVYGAHESVKDSSYPRVFTGAHAAELAGSLLHGTDYIATPGWMYTNIHVLDQALARETILGKEGNKRISRRMQDGFPDQGPYWVEQDLAKTVKSKGCRLVQAYTGMLVFAKPEETKRELELTKALWRRTGFRVMEETDTSAIRAAFPFQYSPSRQFPRQRGCERESLMTTYNAAALAHIQGAGEEASAGKGGVLCLDRRGQLTTLSPGDHPANPNFVVAGCGGSGKTMFALELALDTLSKGGKVVALCRDAQHLASQIPGGKVLCFESAQPQSVNPFSILKDPDKLWLDNGPLRELVMVLMYGAQADALPEAAHSFLEHVLSRVRLEHGKNASLRLLRAELERHASQSTSGSWAAEMSIRLEPFAGGEYSAWFEGENTLTFSESVTAVEVEELYSRDGRLKQAVVASTLYAAASWSCDGLPQRKTILVESDELDVQALSSRFVGLLWRQVRQHRGGFGIVARTMDLVNGDPVWQVVLDNSETEIFLYSSLAYEVGRLFSDGDREMAKSVRTGLGFTEAYVRAKSSRTSGIHRLVLDPVTYATISSNMHDHHRRRALQNSGLDEREAVRQLATECRERFNAGAGMTAPPHWKS